MLSYFSRVFLCQTFILRVGSISFVQQTFYYLPSQFGKNFVACLFVLAVEICVLPLFYALYRQLFTEESKVLGSLFRQRETVAKAWNACETQSITSLGNWVQIYWVPSHNGGTWKLMEDSYRNGTPPFGRALYHIETETWTFQQRPL